MKKIITLILIASLLCLTACSSTPETTEEVGYPMPIYTSVDYVPELSGTEVYSSDYINIDSSNSDQGYIMVQYLGSHDLLIKFQITDADGITYTYTLEAGQDYQVFPLAGGSGTYILNTYEEIGDSEYYVVDSTSIEVSITDETLTYLYPNQFVNFEDGDSVVALSASAAEDTYSELDVITNIYDIVLEQLTYDTEKMTTVASGGLVGYIPNLDTVISEETGICLDYASLMAAMLRIQHIPAKLVIGYAGEAYHAWISVYTEEYGWLDEIIFFNGETGLLLTVNGRPLVLFSN